MRTGLTRFFTSITVMLGITAMLSMVKKEVLFIERPKVEVSEWEVMDQRTMKKLFKVAAQGNQGVHSVFARFNQSDSTSFAPKIKNHSKRSIY